MGLHRAASQWANVRVRAMLASVADNGIADLVMKRERLCDVTLRQNTVAWCHDIQRLSVNFCHGMRHEEQNGMSGHSVAFTHPSVTCSIRRCQKSHHLRSSKVISASTRPLVHFQSRIIICRFIIKGFNRPEVMSIVTGTVPYSDICG